MLELRPTCEHCNKALPPNSLEARICTYGMDVLYRVRRTRPRQRLSNLWRRVCTKTNQAVAELER
jgi:hypothetical protein